MTLADLKRLAEAATPGPYRLIGKQGTAVCADNEILCQMASPRFYDKEARANAAYIAAAYPQRILATIKVIEAARAMRWPEPSSSARTVADFDAALSELEQLE